LRRLPVSKEDTVSNVAQDTRRGTFAEPGRYRRWLTPVTTRPIAVIEVLLVMVVVIVAAALLGGNDPLWMSGPFPWIWLFPLVLALRYGTLLGMVSALALLAGWYVLYPQHSVEGFPVLFFVGGTIQTLIGGHFGDTWGIRSARARALNEYLNDRLVSLTNSHYLLHLSHERLEKDLLTRPATLRDSITRLRQTTASAAAEFKRGGLPNATDFLEFAAQVCQLEVAAIVPARKGSLEGDHTHTTDSAAIAHVGESFAVDPADALVRHCIQTRALAHLTNVDEARDGNTQYVACAPLSTSEGDLLGVLVIKRMPFLSLNHDNLQFLLVLLGYYADGVEHAAVAHAIISEVPSVPYEFAVDLGRLERLQRDASIESSLIALVFPRDDEGDSLLEHINRRRRSLDLTWSLQTPDHSIFLNLMPATDGAGVDGYLARIEDSLHAQFGLSLEAARIGVHTLHVAPSGNGAALKRLLQRCGFDA
jgi:hypothetical protein